MSNTTKYISPVMRIIAPTVDDDFDSGYSVGCHWIDEVTKMYYICTDASNGEALWDNVSKDEASIHGNTSAEISALTEKETPVNADVVLIEDSESSWVKKKLQLSNMLGGGGETVTYATTISSWTLDSGLYRADVTHNLATKDVQVHAYLISDDKTVDVEEIERTSTSTVRIWVASEEDLRICVVSAGGGGGSSSVPSFAYNAHELLSPNTSDWTVNALAPLSADSNNTALNVRLFDDTVEEGIGFLIEVPGGSTNINLKFKSRAETAPGAARTVGLKLYNRGLPDNSAVESWSSGDALTDIDIPASELWQYDSQEIALSTLGVTAGQMTQFELTRINPTAGTELTGDWVLLNLIAEFT